MVNGGGGTYLAAKWPGRYLPIALTVRGMATTENNFCFQ